MKSGQNKLCEMYEYAWDSWRSQQKINYSAETRAETNILKA